MASIHGIKKRLSGTASIHQMTSAMELVAATKMRKSQKQALASRPYAICALEILANVIENTGMSQNLISHPLTQTREAGKTLVVVVGSDRGMAGSLNALVFKKLESYLAASPTGQLNNAQIRERYAFLAIGQKAIDYCTRNGYPLVASFTRLADITKLEQSRPVAQKIMEGFEDGSWSAAMAFITTFISALRQEPVVHQLLPLKMETVREAVDTILPETGRFSDFKDKIKQARLKNVSEYIIEPNPQEVLAKLIPALFAMYTYHILLEANAAEHSSRRAAMKNATDNAAELIEALTLSYNRTRQANITKEITEITSTVAAIGG